MSDELGRRKRVEGLPEWVRPMLDSGSWLGATCAFPVGQDAVSYDVHTPDAKRWLLVRRDRRSGHRSVILVYKTKPDPLEVCEVIVADWRLLCGQEERITMSESKIHIMRFGTDMWCGAEVLSKSGFVESIFPLKEEFDRVTCAPCLVSYLKWYWDWLHKEGISHSSSDDHPGLHATNRLAELVREE